MSAEFLFRMAFNSAWQTRRNNVSNIVRHENTLSFGDSPSMSWYAQFSHVGDTLDKKGENVQDYKQDKEMLFYDTIPD